MPEIQYSYETIGNSSYLVVTFPKGQGVINYQMQMLVNNEIKHIIKANKRQKNDDILISYNITSKISLEQVSTKNKIPKEGMINIIEGILSVFENIEEYQLVTSGIVLDEKNIYVKPGTYEPSFVYLPTSMEDSGAEPVKRLIISLIMGSKVEMTNDNFVQTLLDTINKPGFTIKDLKKLCDDFKTCKANRAKQPERVQTHVAPAQNAMPNQQYVNNRAFQQNFAQQPIQQPMQQPVQQPMQQSVQTPAQPSVMQQTPNAAATAQDGKQKNGNSGKTVLFLVLQLVFVGIVAAVYMNGFLNNENGELITEYLAGIVIAIAGIDFVLYREIFKNSKTEGADTKKKNNNYKNNANNSGVLMPGKDTPAKSAMPGKGVPKAPVKPPINTPQKPEQFAQQPISQPVQTPVAQPQPIPQPVQAPTAQPIPQPAYVAPTQPSQFSQMSDFESEDTVVLDDNSSNGAYLEYYENGLATRIKLNKECFMIGKLRGQCDFTINNNKISKMHAEFITKGNNYFVKDYNSTNGTYINGSNQRIASNAEYQIFNGDRITLANVDMTFRC